MTCRMVSYELFDFLQAQALILRHGKMGDEVGLMIFLGATDQVFQETAKRLGLKERTYYIVTVV
jgi:hypothetical protein